MKVWLAPANGVVKVNADMAIGDGWVGLGVVARDSGGGVLWSSATRCVQAWWSRSYLCLGFMFVGIEIVLLIILLELYLLILSKGENVIFLLKLHLIYLWILYPLIYSTALSP